MTNNKHCPDGQQHEQELVAFSKEFVCRRCGYEGVSEDPAYCAEVDEFWRGVAESKKREAEQRRASECDRLKLIIETALKHGGELTPYDPERGDTWEAQENGVALYNRESELYLFIPVSTVLYGNDCGLLRAACGNEEIPWEVQVNGGWADKKYQWVAAHSVLYPDHKRLRFVTEHLRKD